MMAEPQASSPDLTKPSKANGKMDVGLHQDWDVQKAHVL